jgi:hypothetical protein
MIIAVYTVHLSVYLILISYILVEVQLPYFFSMNTCISWHRQQNELRFWKLEICGFENTHSAPFLFNHNELNFESQSVNNNKMELSPSRHLYYSCLRFRIFSSWYQHIIYSDHITLCYCSWHYQDAGWFLSLGSFCLYIMYPNEPTMMNGAHG